MNGRDGSLGFLLAAEGFDVWLGNTRGNRYSSSHETISPTSPEFWDWSWDAMARYYISATEIHLERSTLIEANPV